MMKIEKKVLAEALKVLGKVCSQTSPVDFQRAIRFVGTGGDAVLMATDGVEVVALKATVEAEGVFDFCVEYKALREIVRVAKKVVELQGAKLKYPELEVVPADAERVVVPEAFGRFLASAAQIVDREEGRLPLRGINLSADGITAANGKQLVHIPVAWDLKQCVTLPFPLALLTAMPNEPGTLSVWPDRFQIEIGNFRWMGKAVAGQFPNWKQVMPQPDALDYAIALREPEKVVTFLKSVPDSPPFHAIEFNVLSDGVAVIPHDFPEMILNAEAEVTGVQPRVVLALNKHILLRMLQQGYTHFCAHSDGQIPVVAEGGDGQFITMPLRVQPQIQTNPITHKEEPKMEATKPMEPVESVNVMDELNAAIDELRGKLKLIFDESAMLTRKVKEAVLAQKQKEREFVLALRAIERIKMAI